ncbi:Mur ligase family protein [Blattabacterium cuenoti]|uniref:Mur ligase family protein n=1 Tax=Blattabacterium cuenoti TaxID=1653831 RepID=UPI0021D2EEF0|nr:Mur ligase family protein [Blattabacterium cuenoti]
MKKELIIILGGGESGIGASLLALKNGFKIFLSDSGKISNKYKKILYKYQIPFEEMGHSEDFILKNAFQVIKSPGISRNNAFIKKIDSLGIPLVSELEFGKSFLKNSYIISVTGSNGKTTTSTIIYNILKSDKKFCVGLAGNIGRSFSKESIKKKVFMY